MEDALSTSPQGTGPHPQTPLRLLAGSSGSATFAGRLGPIAGSPCAAVQNLLFQCVLPEDPHYVGVPSSRSAGPSSALPTPLKAKTAGAPPVHHQLQGEVGAAPPSPALGSWEQSAGDSGSQSSCRQGVNCQLSISVGAPRS